MRRHIDVWTDIWDGNIHIRERYEMGSEEFAHRVKFCATQCWHSYVFHTPPHADGDCRKYVNLPAADLGPRLS